MEYELTDAGTCRKKLLLKFSPEDIQSAFDESYKEINSYVKLNGFRKGKAPRRALESRFAKEAASGVRQQLAEKNLPEVIKKEDLQVLGDVASDNTTSLPVPGKPFDIGFEFNITPEFELPEYQGLELSKQDVGVTDEQVEQEVDRLRKNFSNYEPAGDDEGAEIGDILRVDFETKVDGQEIMAMEDQRLRVDGEVLFGLPCPDLTEKFKGVKKGDFIEVKVTLPQEHPNPELRGREADVEVTVKSVEHGKAPELNDAFAESIGLGNLEHLRQTVRSKLMRDAILGAKQKEEEEIIDKLLDQVSFDIPQNLVDAETNALVEQQRMHLVRTGVKSNDAMDAQMKAYRPEAAKEAAKKVRWSILCQKIAAKENIQVTNDDLAAQVEALAQNYNTTPAKIIQRIREFDGIGPMMAEILSIKVVQFLSNSAKGRGEDTGSANVAAAASAKDISADGHDHECGCGHDHDHGHDHDEGHECGCGHKH